MDDTVESVLSIRPFQLNNLSEFLYSEDKKQTTALSLTDAAALFSASGNDLEKGLYEPGEGDLEPLAMGIEINDPEKDTDGLNLESSLYMYSCIPDYAERTGSVRIHMDRNTGDILGKPIRMPESLVPVWKSWMRIMWGMKCEFRYGNRE